LVLAVELGAGDMNQLLRRVEVERDAFAPEAQAYPQRFLESNEGDAVFAEDAI